MSVRLGILGTGAIAAEVADAADVAAVASRNADRAAGFAAAHGIPRAFGSYGELMADPRLDAVYVATPHRSHAELTIAALRAGKHVLCEKPVTVNAAEAEEVIAAARDAGRLVMEAFAYRFHPQTRTLLRMISDGAIGDVRAVSVTFSFAAGPGEIGRLTSHELAGGGILDVGCYCVSMSQLLAGGGEPAVVAGAARLDPVERVDLQAAALLTYPGPVIAQVECAVTLGQRHEVRVSGTAGEIVIDQPCWIPECRDTPTRIASGSEVLEIPAEGHIFALELAGFEALIAAGPAAWERSWAESLATMRTLDRWRAAAGVRYDWE